MNRFTASVAFLIPTFALAIPAPVEIWSGQNPTSTIYGWRQYPLYTGGNLWRVKNSSHYVVINDSGNEVSEMEVLKEDEDYQRFADGALTPLLVSTMNEYPTKRFVVSLSPYKVRPDNWDHPTTTPDRASMRTLVANHVSTVLAPIVTALTEVGVTPTYVGRVWLPS